MSKRHEFTKRTKLEAWTRCGGKCEGCGIPLKGKAVEYDHDLPAAFGGGNELANCRVLCRDGCHRAKTSRIDIPAIAKSNRIRSRQAGIRKRSTFACSKDKPWKKKLTGEVVPRE